MIEDSESSAISAEREWYTPTLGFGPKWASMASRIRYRSLMNVGTLCLSIAVSGFRPWFLMSWTMRSKSSTSSDQNG